MKNLLLIIAVVVLVGCRVQAPAPTLRSLDEVINIEQKGIYHHALEIQDEVATSVREATGDQELEYQKRFKVEVEQELRKLAAHYHLAYEDLQEIIKLGLVKNW